MLPNLPDVLALGPLHFPTLPLAALLAALLWTGLAPLFTRRLGGDAALAERAATAGAVGLVAGAKLGTCVPALPSLLANPRLLFSLPTGNWAWAGAMLGLLAGVGWRLWRHLRRDMGHAGAPGALEPAGPVLDGLALAALPAAALYAGALPDDRALPTALALLAGAGLLWLARQRAVRPGHLALACLVVLGCIITLADLLRPGRNGVAGGQLAGLILAAVAYGLAVRLAAPNAPKEETHDQ